MFKLVYVGYSCRALSPQVHWRTAGRLELSSQRKSRLYQLELYEHDKSKPFRAKL